MTNLSWSFLNLLKFDDDADEALKSSMHELANKYANIFIKPGKPIA